jgi:hypothetical protein
MPFDSNDPAHQEHFISQAVANQTVPAFEWEALARELAAVNARLDVLEGAPEAPELEHA